jgi:5'-nucleotidase
MKTFVRFVLVCAAAATVWFPAAGQQDTLTILHLNDTHSNLAPIGPRNADLSGTVGGIARAATMIGLTKMTEPNVLALHAGDLFIGDVFYNLYFGIPELRILLSAGLDAMTVGNHEFDLTPSTLLMALDTAFVQGSFPLLSANVNLEAPEVQPLKNYIQPYIVKVVGPVTVGIFGLTTPATNILSQPSPAFIDSDFVSIAAAMVDTLAGKGCKVILCLSHLGSYYDMLVAQNVPGIHAIIGGHDHIVFEEPLAVITPAGDTTWIVQANAFYLNMGRLRFTVTDSTVDLLDYTLIDMDEDIPEEPEVATVVSGLKSEIEATYQIPFFSQQVSYATEDFSEVADSLSSEGYRDTEIGNLVTDAFRWVAKTDIAIEVGGSTAQVLCRGPVVPDDLFRVVGYGFNTDNTLGYRLATFDMKGEALLMGLEFGLSGIELDDEFFIQASGLTYSYAAARDAYQRLADVQINGSPLDPAQMYSVTANEFVPLFLTYIEIPFENLKIKSDTTEFQALLWYVSQSDTLRPPQGGRIRSIVDTAVSAVRIATLVPEQFELHQNFPNPFNPSTSLTFDLPVATTIRLSVSNILGQEIALLASGLHQAGSYTVSWNASGHSSGLYLVRLEGGGSSAVKKILLIR